MPGSSSVRDRGSVAGLSMDNTRVDASVGTRSQVDSVDLDDLRRDRVCNAGHRSGNFGMDLDDSGRVSRRGVIAAPRRFGSDRQNEGHARVAEFLDLGARGGRYPLAESMRPNLIYVRSRGFSRPWKWSSSRSASGTRPCAVRGPCTPLCWADGADSAWIGATPTCQITGTARKEARIASICTNYDDLVCNCVCAGRSRFRVVGSRLSRPLMRAL